MSKTLNFKEKALIKRKKITTLILFIFFTSLQLNGQTFPKKTLSLPEIKEVKHLAIPSALERIFPQNYCQDSLIKLLKTYNRRFSNLREYEVYLVKRSCEFSQNTCLCFQTIAQGEFSFLILYNRKTKQANVLVASYEFLSDSEVYIMSFKINNNEIRLIDRGITDSEKGKAEEFSKEIIKVTIKQWKD